MSHWTFTGRTKSKDILYSCGVYDSEKVHCVRKATVVKDCTMHAELLYSSSGDTLRLINADIFFTGFGNTPDKLFIKNAKLKDLEEYFV